MSERIYIYSCHLGSGLYVSDSEIPYDQLYCETCGDSDQLETCGTKEEILDECRYDVSQAVKKYRDIKHLLNDDEEEHQYGTKGSN